MNRDLVYSRAKYLFNDVLATIETLKSCHGHPMTLEAFWTNVRAPIRSWVFFLIAWKEFPAVELKLLIFQSLLTMIKG